MNGNMYAEAIRKRREQLAALGVPPAQIEAQAPVGGPPQVSGMTDPYAQSEQMAQMQTAIDTGERGVQRQQAMADAIRGNRMQELTSVGGIAAANPYNALSNAASMLTGAYVDKRAAERDAAMDPQREELAKAKAAQEAAMYADQRRDVAVQQGLDERGMAVREGGLANTVEATAADIASQEARDDLAFAEFQQQKAMEDAKFAQDVKEYEEERARWRENLALKRDEMAADLAAAKAKGEAEAKKEIDKQVTSFSDTLVKEDIPQMQEALDNFYGVLEDIGVDGNIPGIGGFMNSNMAGPAFAALVDNLNGDEAAARRVQQAARGVMNARIKQQSGATVTVQEMFREMTERGLSIFDSDEDLLRGIEQVKNQHDALRDTIRNGYSDEVLAVFDQRELDRRKKLVDDEEDEENDPLGIR